MAAKKKAPAKKKPVEEVEVKPEFHVEPVKNKPSEEELIKEARSLWGPLANKTRAYLIFVKEHKADMPSEYEFAKHLIIRFLGE